MGPDVPEIQTTGTYILADASLASRLPIRLFVNGTEFSNFVSQTTSYTSATCTNTAFPRDGVLVSISTVGAHKIEAFSTVDTSWWELSSVTVTSGACNVIKLSCTGLNSYCGDRTFQNFGMTTASSNRTIQACVRDHECQDGDRVRVSFQDIRGGAQTLVFPDQELTNAGTCKDVSVPQSGLYIFTLQALNGTGFKNNCDFSDINTGELLIAGAQGTPRWNIRSGAGTTSAGYVKVP